MPDEIKDIYEQKIIDFFASHDKVLKEELKG